jgi:hypothetical protein
MGSEAANASGYDGSTQTVAIADTGIGGGTASTAHAHIPANRIAAIFDWPGAADSCFQTIVNDGSRDVDSGHGTHVSVSALGDGGSTGGKGLPRDDSVFQSVENYATTTTRGSSYGDSTAHLNGIWSTSAASSRPATRGPRIELLGQEAGHTDSVNADQFVWRHDLITSRHTPAPTRTATA